MNLERIMEYAAGYRLVVMRRGDDLYAWRVSHLSGHPPDYYIVDGSAMPVELDCALMAGRAALRAWATRYSETNGSMNHER